MDYRKSIRALFEAVLLEGRTTGGDYEATGQRVGAFIGKKGNNTRRNRERADRIVDRLADKEYKDKGDEGGPVAAPFNKGFRKGYVDTVRQQYESSNNARRNLRALFEAVLSEEGFEYQKPGQLSKNKRNQAEYEDRREKELSGRIVMRGGGNLLDKDLMPGAYRQAARGKRAIEADSPHSKDRYGNPRSVPDTHTFMNLAHVKADNAAKRAARERRLAAKAARLAAKAQTQNSSTDHSRDNLKNIFEAALLEGERKMRRYSDEYPGGPAEKRLMTSKPGTLSASGKKQLAAGARAYEKATSKKVESIRNIFNNILKEATYQAGTAKSPDKYGVRRGTAKLSKSNIKGVTKDEAERVSRRNQERDFARQRDAKFRQKHGSMSAAERRRENQLMNRPMGLRKKDPEDHYPQD